MVAWQIADFRNYRSGLDESGDLPGASAEARGLSIAGGWAIVCLLALVVALLGERALHALAPTTWLAAIAGLSVAATVAVAQVLRPARPPDPVDFAQGAPLVR